MKQQTNRNRVWTGFLSKWRVWGQLESISRVQTQWGHWLRVVVMASTGNALFQSPKPLCGVALLLNHIFTQLMSGQMGWVAFRWVLVWQCEDSEAEIGFCKMNAKEQTGLIKTHLKPVQILFLMLS